MQAAADRKASFFERIANAAQRIFAKRNASALDYQRAMLRQDDKEALRLAEELGVPLSEVQEDARIVEEIGRLDAALKKLPQKPNITKRLGDCRRAIEELRPKIDRPFDYPGNIPVGQIATEGEKARLRHLREQNDLKMRLEELRSEARSLDGQLSQIHEIEAQIAALRSQSPRLRG